MCLATAASVTTRARAIAALERPSAISASTSRSRGGQPGQRVAAAAQQLPDHLRVDDRAARRRPVTSASTNSSTSPTRSLSR